MEFSCWSDASLLMVASSLRCTWAGTPRDECEAAARDDFAMDWLLCGGLQDTAPQAESLALLSPEEIEALTPMRIIELLKKEEISKAKPLEEAIAKEVEKKPDRTLRPKAAAQVVEITEPTVEAAPEKTRFVSEFDSRVERETVARGSTEPMHAKPASQSSEGREDTPPEAADKFNESSPSEQLVERGAAESGPKGAEREPRRQGLLAMRALRFQREMIAGDRIKSPKPMNATADGLEIRASKDIRSLKGKRKREAQEAIELAGRGGSGGNGRSGVISLRLKPERLMQLLGGGSVDRLDGVATGEFTALSSKKWKFAGFFNRMKRQVAREWHPAAVYARSDPKGKVFGTKNRLTVLRVTLDSSGKLGELIVLKDSGVSLLDSEAIAAFERAQPFPNPPHGLIESSGNIVFSFGFTFQVGSRRSSWNVFRAL